MTDDSIVIERTLDPAPDGGSTPLIWQIEVEYRKGHGITVTVRSERRSGTARHIRLFAHGHMGAVIWPLARKRPKLLRETGERLTQHADLLFAEMDGWLEEDRWSRAEQQAFMQERLAPILRGDIAPGKPALAAE